MDPIQPILTSPAAIAARPPVEALERITRERDRPARERDRRRRRNPDAAVDAVEPPSSVDPEHSPDRVPSATTTDRAGRGQVVDAGDEDDGQRPHIDVRA